MIKRTIRVGKQSYADIKNRTIAIVSGAYKPAAGEPKVWFVSLKSFASVLSEENAALLAEIRKSRPEILADRIVLELAV